MSDDQRYAVGELTEEQLAWFKAEWERKSGQRPRFLTPLPRRTRLRLAVAHVIDGIGIWLVNREHAAAAGWLWRITGRWTT